MKSNSRTFFNKVEKTEKQKKIGVPLICQPLDCENLIMGYMDKDYSKEIIKE
jgi:hypothetical protein